jgi:hypothetical protein
VVESLKDSKPITVLASRSEVHYNQVALWRKQFLSNAQSVFSGDKAKE